MSVLNYIYIQEANRIIQGLSKSTGKPIDHVEGIWKETEKEVISKHQFGVTDGYKKIGGIVRSKLGLKPEEDTDKKQED